MGRQLPEFSIKQGVGIEMNNTCCLSFTIVMAMFPILAANASQVETFNIRAVQQNPAEKEVLVEKLLSPTGSLDDQFQGVTVSGKSGIHVWHVASKTNRANAEVYEVGSVPYMKVKFQCNYRNGVETGEYSFEYPSSHNGDLVQVNLNVQCVPIDGQPPIELAVISEQSKASPTQFYSVEVAQQGINQATREVTRQLPVADFDDLRMLDTFRASGGQGVIKVVENPLLLSGVELSQSDGQVYVPVTIDCSFTGRQSISSLNFEYGDPAEGSNKLVRGRVEAVCSPMDDASRIAMEKKDKLIASRNNELMQVKAQLAASERESEELREKLSKVPEKAERQAQVAPRSSENASNNRSGSDQPSVNNALSGNDEVENAFLICSAAESTGLLSEQCDISGWSQTITMVMDVPSMEARQLCQGIVSQARSAGMAFRRGDWSIKIVSPYSNGTAIAKCSLM